MSATGFSYKISGADKFQFLLDTHIRRNQRSGNIIKLSIEVNGNIDVSELRRMVTTNEFLTQINSIDIEEGFLKIPRWKNGTILTPVKITEHIETDEGIVFTKEDSPNTLLIDLIHAQGNSVLLISIHHAIADNIGIQNIARVIAGTIKPEGPPFADEEKETISFAQQLIHTLKATRLVFKKTPKRMAKLVATEAATGISTLDFDEEETRDIEENVVKNEARLSRSSFYLAATAMALKQTIFADKGDSFFLPVPQNKRLRGDGKVTMGNHLSFLFYNIPFSKLNNLREATAFITEQMVQQLKEQSPRSYSYLLKTFRFLPLPVYDFFFKLPTKGAVCSFLFSDVGETLPEMKTFMGKEIVEVLNYPPNPCPPHITFVVMKHAGTLKIITSYNSKAINSDEITMFEDALTELLLP